MKGRCREKRKHDRAKEKEEVRTGSWKGHVEMVHQLHEPVLVHPLAPFKGVGRSYQLRIAVGDPLPRPCTHPLNHSPPNLSPPCSSLRTLDGFVQEAELSLL